MLSYLMFIADFDATAFFLGGGDLFRLGGRAWMERLIAFASALTGRLIAVFFFRRACHDILPFVQPKCCEKPLDPPRPENAQLTRGGEGRGPLSGTRDAQ